MARMPFADNCVKICVSFSMWVCVCETMRWTLYSSANSQVGDMFSRYWMAMVARFVSRMLRRLCEILPAEGVIELQIIHEYRFLTQCTKRHTDHALKLYIYTLQSTEAQYRYDQTRLLRYSIKWIYTIYLDAYVMSNDTHTENTTHICWLFSLSLDGYTHIFSLILISISLSLSYLTHIHKLIHSMRSKMHAQQ